MSWITVKERLPAQGEEVHICCNISGDECKYYFTAFLLYDKWNIILFEPANSIAYDRQIESKDVDVIAWKPLEEYKETD